MNSKTIQAALMFIGLLMLGMFLAQWIVTLPEFYQIFTICVFVLLALLLLIKPKIGLDIKFLFFVCLGYAFGGKGFAYISPFEPFYISEVCLMLCLLGFLLRAPQSWNFVMMPRMGLMALFIFLAYSGLRLGLVDFPRYRLLAVRDACLAYYALFVFTTIIACQKDENFLLLKKMFIWMGPLALFGIIANKTGLTWKLHSVFPYSARLFTPHDDITIPIVVASAVTAFLFGIRRKNLITIAYAFLCLAALSTSKTAAVFTLIVLFGTLIFFTGRKELVMAAMVGVVIVIIGVGIISLIGIEFGGENEHLSTFTDVTELDLYGDNTNTTTWRLSWWRIIAEDTWKYNPVMGAGFGGDISGAFAEQVLGVKLPPELLAKAGFARYPHNIFFTVLGRCGFIIVVLFTLMQIGMFLRMGRFARHFFSHKKIDYGLFMAVSFVIAGIANSFVQMTYEGPYAAIPHWVALGFVYAYFRRQQYGLSV